MKATDYIANFNNLRNNFIFAGNLFTKEQLEIALKDISLSAIISSYLIKHKIIELKEGGRRKGKAKYSFTNIERPIHKDLFQVVLDDYSKQRSEANKKYREKPLIEKSEKVPLLKEEEAIQLLKSLGYRIYKKVISYEEIN